MKKFQINKYISLHLEDEKTFIYINGKKFRQCMRLLMHLPTHELEKYENIESIDEAAQIFKPEEPNPIDVFMRRIPKPEVEISPEDEFWGHCSNLQAWVESGYDARLIHSNLAFPVLKELMTLGDNLAGRIFKEEVASRFRSGFILTMKFLIKENYLEILTKEELAFLFNEFNYADIFDEKDDETPLLFEKLIGLGALGAKEFYLAQILKIFRNKNYEEIQNLILLKFLTVLERNEREDISEKIPFDFLFQERPSYAVALVRELMDMDLEYPRKYLMKKIQEELKKGIDGIKNIIYKSYLVPFNTQERIEILKNINHDTLHQLHEQSERFNYIKRLKVLEFPPAIEYYRQMIAESIKNDENFPENVVLILKGLLNSYSQGEIADLFSDFDYLGHMKDYPEQMAFLVPELMQYGIKAAKDFFYEGEFLDFFLRSEEIPFFRELNEMVEIPIRICLAEYDFPFHIRSPRCIIVKKKQIREIYLYQLEIKELPSSIGNLASLEKLVVNDNHLTTLPQSIKLLDNLREINLTRNKLGHIPFSILLLERLHKLDISVNSLRIIPENIKKLVSLIELNFSRNLLTDIPKELFQLPNLKSINLNYNKIRRIPSYVNQAQSLSIFYCDYNHLEVLPIEIKDVKELQRLSIDGNYIPHLDGTFSELISLEFLSIDKSILKQPSLKIIKDLSRKGVFVSTPPYRLRFFFEAGGYYFWGYGQNTEKKYGYPIFPEKLPLKIEHIDMLNQLHKEYEMLVHKERKKVIPSWFKEKVDNILDKVEDDLGSRFQIIRNL